MQLVFGEGNIMVLSCFVSLNSGVCVLAFSGNYVCNGTLALLGALAMDAVMWSHLLAIHEYVPV